MKRGEDAAAAAAAAVVDTGVDAAADDGGHCWLQSAGCWAFLRGAHVCGIVCFACGARICGCGLRVCACVCVCICVDTQILMQPFVGLEHAKSRGRDLLAHPSTAREVAAVLEQVIVMLQRCPVLHMVDVAAFVQAFWKLGPAFYSHAVRCAFSLPLPVARSAAVRRILNEGVYLPLLDEVADSVVAAAAGHLDGSCGVCSWCHSSICLFVFVLFFCFLFFSVVSLCGQCNGCSRSSGW